MDKAGTTIVFQGDSITDTGRSRESQDNPNAVWLGLGGGYPLFATGRLLTDFPERDFRFFNRGISGNRVVDLYARWKIDCLNLKPDLISILIGVNDTWHEFGSRNGVEVPRYEKVYRELLTWTRTALPDVKLMLLEPFVFPIGAATAEWVPEIRQRAAIVRALAAEFQATFVPLQADLDAAAARATREHYLPDGVHPSPAGHQFIADRWVKAAKGLLGC